MEILETIQLRIRTDPEHWLVCTSKLLCGFDQSDLCLSVRPGHKSGLLSVKDTDLKLFAGSEMT